MTETVQDRPLPDLEEWEVERISRHPGDGTVEAQLRTGTPIVVLEPGCASAGARLLVAGAAAASRRSR